MDNLRLLLVVGLATVSLLLWEAWQRDYGPAAPEPSAAESAQTETPAPAGAEAPPAVGDATAAPEGAGEPASAGGAAEHPVTDVITVRTDVLDLQIDLQGGSIVRATLPRYPISIDHPDQPFVLLDHSAERFFVLQTGLAGDRAPDHRTRLQTPARHFELGAGEDVLEVPLSWHRPDGLLVQKVLRLHRGSYEVEVRYRVRNAGTEPWQGRVYGQLQRRHEQRKGGLGTVRAFVGAALSSPEKRYEKFDFDDLTELAIDRDITGGWVAIIEHYFLAALAPPAEQPFHYYSRVLDGDRYLVGAYGPTLTVPPGEEREVGLVTFIGPKLQHVLAAIAPGLDLTVDYGWLWFIAKPLYWVLEHLHGLTGNWGVAIVLVTVLLKLVFFPLSAMGYRSMARMRKVQPRMMALRDRFKDDRQRLNQAMMELYRSERINPFGGCLPILVQIPFFIALYWVLLESVELRQAPFFGWIRDLSTRDPYFVLPLVMGVSMWFQQRLNPAPTDPVQQQVMKVLPIVFTVFFAFFPSGLVLYWVVNNILSIGQQWVITRRIEAGG